MSRSGIERHFRLLEFPVVLGLCFLLTRRGSLLDAGALLLPAYAFARGLWRYHTEVSGFGSGRIDPRVERLYYRPVAGAVFGSLVAGYAGAIAWLETEWWWVAPAALLMWVLGLRLGAWVAHRWHYDPAAVASGE